MNVSASKYGTSPIVRNFYSVESNGYTYLAVHDICGTNQQNDVTYDPQCTNGKIITTITIITCQPYEYEIY